MGIEGVEIIFGRIVWRQEHNNFHSLLLNAGHRPQHWIRL